jgi:hypothetical protein
MMQTKGKRLSFGAWKLDPGLQHLWDLLSISGDLPGVAFDGLDHSSGWMEHLIGSPILLYFESINELMSMLVDLRVVMDKNIRAFPYATDNLIAHGALKIVGQAGTITTEECAIYAHINPANNFTSVLVEHGSLHTFLLTFNLAEICRFALLMGEKPRCTVCWHSTRGA